MTEEEIDLLQKIDKEISDIKSTKRYNKGDYDYQQGQVSGLELARGIIVGGQKS